MLDIRTLLVATSATILVTALAWLVVWIGQPRLPGVRNWTLAAIATGIGIALLSLRGLIDGWFSVVLANSLVMFGQGLAVYAVADVLERPRPRLVVYGVVGLTFLLWPIFWAVWPDDLSLRVTVYAALALVLFGAITWMLITTDTLPRLQRLPFAFLSALHMLAIVLRGVTGTMFAGNEDYLSAELWNSIWTFENAISVIIYTVTFAVLLGARLTRDLQRQNEALSEVIATQRMLQVQLHGALSQEASMRREQQHFVSRICGGFDGPLKAIDQRASDLRRLPEMLRGSVEPRLDAITGAARRLRLLVDTFLLDRRILGGMAEMKQDAVDLSSLIADLLREQARPGARPGAEWRLRFHAPEQPVTARGDAAMLAVVFGNLVDNALKYSAADKPVDVTLDLAAEEAVVTVTDQGIGIPAADLNAIGQRFFRAANAAGVPGTGLGLFSAGRLIQFHGGRFLVDSEPDRGTRITVHLPLYGMA